MGSHLLVKYGVLLTKYSTRIRNGVRSKLKMLLTDECGQGTTEYAILVGVIVVIAIVAVIAFRSKIQELWDAIADGINSL